MVVGFVGIRQSYARYYFEQESDQSHLSLTATVLFVNLAVPVLVILPVLTLVALLGRYLGSNDLTLGIGEILAA